MSITCSLNSVHLNLKVKVALLKDLFREHYGMDCLLLLFTKRNDSAA